MRAINDVEIKVKVDIRPGQTTERQKRLWRDWWSRLIASASEEMENEEKSENA